MIWPFQSGISSESVLDFVCFTYVWTLFGNLLIRNDWLTKHNLDFNFVMPWQENLILLIIFFYILEIEIVHLSNEWLINVKLLLLLEIFIVHQFLKLCYECMCVCESSSSHVLLFSISPLLRPDVENFWAHVCLFLSYRNKYHLPLDYLNRWEMRFELVFHLYCYCQILFICTYCTFVFIAH